MRLPPMIAALRRVAVMVVAELLGLNARFPDDAAPLVDLVFDDAAEMLGGAALDLDAGTGEPRAYVFHLERGVDAGVEPGDGVFRRTSRREYAAPGARVVAREAGFR